MIDLCIVLKVFEIKLLFNCCLLVKHNLLLAFFTLSEKKFKPDMSDPIHICPDILSDECLKIILSLVGLMSHVTIITRMAT